MQYCPFDSLEISTTWLEEGIKHSYSQNTLNSDIIGANESFTFYFGHPYAALVAVAFFVAGLIVNPVI